MTTATHILTNGVSNFLFTVSGNVGTLTTVNEFGALIQKETMSVSALRDQWKAALKHGCKRGYINPRRVQPSAFDREDDNRWEAELALLQG